MADDLRDVLRRTADDVELLMSSAWSRMTDVEHTMGQQIIGRIIEALAEGDKTMEELHRAARPVVCNMPPRAHADYPYTIDHPFTEV